jgi:hypothetical protein
MPWRNQWEVFLLSTHVAGATALQVALLNQMTECTSKEPHGSWAEPNYIDG